MPCINATHIHEWATTGTLSIAKCESRCGFCSSTKEYKPASALRKHVATHIKNDKMSLTLAQSTGGRPRLQAVLDLHDVPKLSQSPAPSRESPLLRSPVLPGSVACWRCTILKLECNRISPCNACIGLDPPRSCGYASLAAHTSLIFSGKPYPADNMSLLARKLIYWEDEFDFSQSLQWRGSLDRSIHVTFTDAETMDLEQNDQYQIVLRRRTLGDGGPVSQLLCSQMDPAVKNCCIVVQAAHALVDLSQSPEPLIGLHSTLRGLLLLESCRSFLDATDRIFTAALYESQTKNIEVIRSLVPGKTLDIKRMIRRFLGGLYDITVKTTAKSRLECVLEAFYGILLLFMVRSTLRSILRYPKFGFTPFGHQANQDHSFERGLTCTLYQPMLAVLESSKIPFEKMLSIQDSDGNCRPAEVYDAARVIDIPNHMTATPLEHILYFFEKVFPARVASTGKSVESAADPSTYVDPATYFQLPG